VPDPLIIELDSQPLHVARDIGHNRWHPDIPPIAAIEVGREVRIDVRDGGDFQLNPETGDVPDYDKLHWELLHPLTGPFYVQGVEPGDLVDVEVLDIQDVGWGFTWDVPNHTGVVRGLTDDSKSLLVHWVMEDGYARAPQLPGVKIPENCMLGTIGVAPSHEQLEQITAREQASIDQGFPGAPPTADYAVPDDPAIAETGLRTIPGREIGGNIDVKDIEKGATVTFVANVDGALLSIGDPHFSMGDGESYCTSLEMPAKVTFRVARVRKAADVEWTPPSPVIYHPSPRLRDNRPFFITTGLPLSPEGEQLFNDVEQATRNALEAMCDYLEKERGFTREQAHVIVSVAADVRESLINSWPTCTVTVALPLDIFE